MSFSWGASARPLAATTSTARARSASRGGGVCSSRGDVGGRGAGRGGGGGGGSGGVGDSVVEMRHRREGIEAAARRPHQIDDARKAQEDAEERHRETLAFMAR